MPPVGADHHTRALDHLAVPSGVAADARHLPVGRQDLVDHEALTQLRPRLDSGVDQDPVEDRSAGAVGVRDPVDRSRGPRDRERAEVEGVRADGRAAGRDDVIEQTPASQGGDPGQVDHVRRERVARERRAIQQQDLVALSSEEHRGRRARAARTNDDHVVGVVHWDPRMR
jgi:hypothetical protein